MHRFRLLLVAMALAGLAACSSHRHVTIDDLPARQSAADQSGSPKVDLRASFIIGDSFKGYETLRNSDSLFLYIFGDISRITIEYAEISTVLFLRTLGNVFASIGEDRPKGEYDLLIQLETEPPRLTKGLVIAPFTLSRQREFYRYNVLIKCPNGDVIDTVSFHAIGTGNLGRAFQGFEEKLRERVAELAI